MKRFIFSCLLGLTLVVGDAQAQMQIQRGQVQPGINPNAQATVVQTPATIDQGQRPTHADHTPAATTAQPGTSQKPPGTTGKPSVAPNKPSQPGVPAKPPVVSGKPPEPVKPSVVSVGANATFAQPQQNFVGGQREFRKFRPDGNFHKGDSHHRNCRSNFVVVYVNGAPYWYPFYTAYPYYYQAPPTMVDNNSAYIPPVDQGGDDTVQGGPSYAELGRQWGQDLRREIATWDDFVDYVRAYIVVAVPAAQADFREAFIASYGLNGAAAYDKAADDAAQASSTQGPKVINMHPAY